MTAIEIIYALRELIQDGKIDENQEIMIDVEAAGYDCHIVPIAGMSYNSKEDIGFDEHLVCFHIDSKHWRIR
jgi:hypothetical protein